jgi:hypothetical protein
MIWKTIGQSAIGTSHIQNGKGCEDASIYKVITLDTKEDVLVCFVSDGAGSAKFAGKAATNSVTSAVNFVEDFFAKGELLSEERLIALAEHVYDHLVDLATKEGCPKNEFSCTLLGCILTPEKAGFLQIGDGAIIRNDGSGHYKEIWWPHNGEYQNSTAFLIDDPNLPYLNKKIIDESISEVAIFTDGLQHLALNQVDMNVHQPFFKNFFPLLSKATQDEHLSILNGRLIDYLSSETINSRTDDDKTLVLATKE